MDAGDGQFADHEKKNEVNEESLARIRSLKLRADARARRLLENERKKGLEQNGNGELIPNPPDDKPSHRHKRNVVLTSKDSQATTTSTSAPDRLYSPQKIGGGRSDIQIE